MTNSSTERLLEETNTGIISPEFYGKYLAFMAGTAANDADVLGQHDIKLGWWSRRVLRQTNRPLSEAALAKLLRDLPSEQRQSFVDMVLAGPLPPPAPADRS